MATDDEIPGWMILLGGLGVAAIAIAQAKRKANAPVPCPSCGNRIAQYTPVCPHCHHRLSWTAAA